MPKIRTLLVDDEALANQRLRRLLGAEPDIEIVGECQDGPSAIEACRTLRPDLVFLDIGMPAMDGFAVLAGLGSDAPPAVIFVTAYDDHALRAFDARALDYVLKPAARPRLQQALERARLQLRGRDVAPRPAAPVPRLAVRVGGRETYVPATAIEWVEAASNYVVLHTAAETHIVRETLAGVEATLPAEQFMRVSRSAIVNLSAVTGIEAVGPEEHVAVLRKGDRIPLRRGVRELKERLRGG
ncbi:MAG: response regulator transcription factor [Verrucomicrobia bacterium]|nr:response regulator transcription factor [Verrucomicrobiota bacterium]